MNDKVDYSKLPKDLQDKLSKWEQNTPASKQLKVLNDIADISQEIINVLDEQTKSDKADNQKMGALLADMHSQLTKLNSKEAPEMPDYAKPIVKSLQELKKCMADMKPPVVNMPKVEAPIVNVDAPKVDLAKLEKLLKTDIPKAFKDSIKLISIPENDDTSTLILLQELSTKLDSIDTGVRMKPIAPTTIKVTNPDGTIISSSNNTANSISSSVSVTTSNLTVLASNSSRKGATIYNESGAIAYVKLGATASTTSYTIQIIIGAYYEVPYGYTGIIDGITSSGTAVLRISELT